MNMLEYVKMILEKVSFDKSLFEKELKKGIKELANTEIQELKEWCYQRFSFYQSVLNKIFTKVSFS